MRRDNLFHFLSLDYQIVSQNSEMLYTRGKFSITQMRQHRINVGEAMVFPDKKFHTFHLFPQKVSNEQVNLNHLNSSLASLKQLIDSLNEKTFSISMKYNNLDSVGWGSIESLLKQIFNDSKYTITICTGEIIIPHPSERSIFISEYHESVVGGHQGVTKLFKRIREDFYWAKMGKQISDFVRTCPTCQKNKLLSPKTRQPMRITDTPKRAFEKVQMDIVGPLPVTQKGNKYLLTIQDNLTKYSDAIPLATIDSISIAIALAEQFICRFGCPRTIQTDQGSNFVSQIMKSFCKIFKIQRITSTAFHPQSLGSLERAHRVFIDYLKAFCSKVDWDEWIRFGIFSYNTSVHDSTGFTPHELIF